MRDRGAAWVAEAAGGELVAGDPHGPGPVRAVVDSRVAGPGDLFVGLRGERADGGTWAAAALERGAWGALVAPEHATALVRAAGGESRAVRAGAAAAGAPDGAPAGAAGAPAGAPDGVPPGAAAAGAPDGAPGRRPTGAPALRPAVIAVPDPLAALARLARAWRRELGCPVAGVTGSTGKTSTKDILAALLRPSRRTHASRENLNTEVGLPLSLLEAERGTEAVVLEMAMRGEGQIAELVAIAEPDVGVVVNVGPVHLELLGTVERVAAAKAELIRDLPAGGTCVVPAGEPLLAAHLRDDLRTLTFGTGGDVALRAMRGGRAELDVCGEPVALELSYSEPHNVLNTLAAVAAVRALGAPLPERVEVSFSSLRGEVVELAGGVTVVNDCYNANPMSMRAALEHLAAAPAGRRIAVLGTMAELGPGSERFHREVGERARELGIDALVTVGEPALPYLGGFDGPSYPVGTPEEAGALLEEIASPGDRVLVKGSRSAGLERVLSPASSVSVGG